MFYFVPHVEQQVGAIPPLPEGLPVATLSLARIMQEPPAATADMAVLPCKW